MQLRPVSYHLDAHKIAAHLKEDDRQDKDGKTFRMMPDKFTVNARDKASQQWHHGFIAQDVEELVRKLNVKFDAVEKPADAEGLYGLRYSEFIVPLVKAVQQQNQVIEELLKRIATLEAANTKN